MFKIILALPSRFILEPTHKASFHPNNFSSLIGHSLYEIQRLLFLSLSVESCNLQRRFLKIEVANDIFSSFHISFLIKIVCAPRSIKLALFRFLKIGLPLNFSEHISLTSNMGLLLSNIFLSGIETIHPFAFRYDNFLICLLRPLDDEKDIVKRINIFFLDRGLNSKFFSDLKSSVVNGLISERT